MSFKNWLRVGATAVLSLALSTTIAVAQGQGTWPRQTRP